MSYDSDALPKGRSSPSVRALSGRLRPVKHRRTLPLFDLFVGEPQVVRDGPRDRKNVTGGFVPATSDLLRAQPSNLP
jgi:hypothetical protein